jgi:double-strand break repair protein MRE11
LYIWLDTCQVDALPLRTVRPFVSREVKLAEHEDDRDLHSEEELTELLAEQVEAVLEEIASMQPTTPLTEADENRAKYPLVRLRVDYSGYTTCNTQKFGNRFVGRVANPTSLITWHRKPVKRAAGGESKRGADDEEEYGRDGATNVPEQIQGLLGNFLSAGGAKEQLRLLPSEVLNAAD